MARTDRWNRAAVALAVLAGLYSGSAYPRDLSERAAFLVELGKCKSTSACDVPQGYEVDHLIPLWAGGADVRANMQLLKTDVHRREKTAREAPVRGAFRSSGQLNLAELPGWKKGIIRGRVERVYRDYSIDVTVVMLPKSEKRPVRLKLKLDGVKAFSEPSDGGEVESILKGNGVGSYITFLPSAASTIGMGAPLHAIPSVAWPEGQERVGRSINETVLERGLAEYDSRSKIRAKGLSGKLERAYKSAKANYSGYWGAQKLKRDEANRKRSEELAERKRQRDLDRSYGSSEVNSDGDYDGGSGSVQVRGYVRSNGTYVAPYTRSSPVGKYR